MKLHNLTALLAGFLLAFGVCATVAASPLENYGLGARSISLASSDAATVTNFTAGFTNPAGFALAKDAQFTLGYMYFRNAMKINGVDAGNENTKGVSLGILYPIHINDDWNVGTGISLYVPEQRVVRVRLLSPDSPRFLQFDNRVHRLVASFTNAVSYKGISLGIGLNIFAGANGRGALFRMSSGPDQPDLADTDLILSLKTRVYASAGIMWQATDWLRVGFYFTDQVQLEIITATDADLDIDLGFDRLVGNAGAGVEAITYYTPRIYALGVEVRATEGLTLSAAVQYMDWRGFPGVLTIVTPNIDLDMNTMEVPIEVPLHTYEDQGFDYQITGAIGVEYGFTAAGVRFDLRAGYKFLPSPLNGLSKEIIILDKERHILAFGAGFTLPPFAVFLGNTEINLGFQYQIMPGGHRDTLPQAAVLPLDYSGYVFGGSMDVVLHF